MGQSLLYFSSQKSPTHPLGLLSSLALCRTPSSSFEIVSLLHLHGIASLTFLSHSHWALFSPLTQPHSLARLQVFHRPHSAQPSCISSLSLKKQSSASPWPSVIPLWSRPTGACTFLDGSLSTLKLVIWRPEIQEAEESLWGVYYRGGGGRSRVGCNAMLIMSLRAPRTFPRYTSCHPVHTDSISRRFLVLQTLIQSHGYFDLNTHFPES